MRCSVTFDGVPIGVAWLKGAPLAAGRFARFPAFDEFQLRSTAHRLGVAVTAARWSRVPPHAAQRALVSALRDTDDIAPRLGLVDSSGASIPVLSIALVTIPRRAPVPKGTYVVVRLDEHPASIPAALPQLVRGGRGRNRPAA